MKVNADLFFHICTVPDIYRKFGHNSSHIVKSCGEATFGTYGVIGVMLSAGGLDMLLIYVA